MRHVTKVNLLANIRAGVTPSFQAWLQVSAKTAKFSPAVPWMSAAARRVHWFAPRTSVRDAPLASC
jgi:hypothetical protein